MLELGIYVLGGRVLNIFYQLGRGVHQCCFDDVANKLLLLHKRIFGPSVWWLSTVCSA